MSQWLTGLTFDERLTIKLEQSKRAPNECWEWVGACDPYPCLQDSGRVRHVHRLILQKKIRRKLKAFEYACHSCDNQACVNPRHLFVGSPKDNVQDSIRKGRFLVNRVPLRGEQAGRAKLTAEVIREIQTRYQLGGISQTSLAKEFGVSHSRIWQIVHRYDRWSQELASDS